MATKTLSIEEAEENLRAAKQAVKEAREARRKEMAVKADRARITFAKDMQLALTTWNYSDERTIDVLSRLVDLAKASPYFEHVAQDVQIALAREKDARQEEIEKAEKIIAERGISDSSPWNELWEDCGDEDGEPTPDEGTDPNEERREQKSPHEQ